MLALCPNCEKWQPVAKASTTHVPRRCVLGIAGAPKVALCPRFLQAPGRGGIHEWVEPSEGNCADS